MQILTRHVEPGFPAEWEGLDEYSAIEATPKWYGVNYGNGNDGVPHVYANFFVRTTEPFTLATAALVGEMKPEYRAWALENCETDGEAEFTISATLYEGPDGETEFGAAWLICEVFPADEKDLEATRGAWGKPAYFSVDHALDVAPLTLDQIRGEG